MKLAIVILFALVAAGAIYWWVIRPVLRRWAMLTPVWAEIDARELRAGQQLAELFGGLKTRLSAAVVWLSGLLLALHDFILPYVAGVDWSPLTAQLPPWAWPLILVLLGSLFGWLRTVSFGPPAKV